jgi:ubiquinone/menaquinone biosynthesis C-methylase UbiE
MSRKSFDDFDGYARDYRRTHNEVLRISGTDSDYFSEQKIEEVRKKEDSSIQRILDIGCGDGNSAAYFQKHFDRCIYTGVDTSKESLLIAKGRELAGAEFVHYNGFDMPFTEGCFDIAFIACVLHHIDSKQHERILKDAKRVLKPGGRLYIFEHNPFNPVTQRVVKSCPFDDDAVLMRSSYIRKILWHLKFQSVNVVYTIFFPRHRVFKGMLPFERYLSWLPLGGQYFVRSVKSSGGEQ